jgi:hypothetical protein
MEGSGTMMILPNPSVLEPFHAERQRRLRPTPRFSGAISRTHAPSLRVRIGRALIGAGTALSGERVEPARPTTKPQPRAA